MFTHCSLVELMAVLRCSSIIWLAKTGVKSNSGKGLWASTLIMVYMDFSKCFILCLMTIFTVGIVYAVSKSQKKIKKELVFLILNDCGESEGHAWH